jgi:polar amino acid transport system permease protein
MIRQFGPGDAWLLLLATRWTVLLTLTAFIGGGVGGAVVAVARVAPAWLVRRVAAAYITLLQGIPPLILLFLVFFGSTILGMRIEPWTAAALGYGMYGSAFLGEIWRGSLQAVPHGQRDAATALALTFAQRLRLVIVPQAARIALPPTVGFLVQLLKSTSLASVIGFGELTWTGQMLNNITFEPLAVFGMVAGLYFALCWPLSLLSARLETRLVRP